MENAIALRKPNTLFSRMKEAWLELTQCKCNQGRYCSGGYQDDSGTWHITYSCADCDKVLYTETISNAEMNQKWHYEAAQQIFEQTGYRWELGYNYDENASVS